MQVHGQMITTGMQKGYLAGITAKANVPLIVFEVTRSKELDAAIVETVDEFWKNWIEAPEKVKKRAASNYRKYMQLVKDSSTMLGIFEYPEEKKQEVDEDTMFGVKS
jgi:hypothetical protein